jgi:nucleoside-diphosphate-sugar epimerase
MKVCVLGSNGFIGKNLMKWRWINWVGISRKELNLLDQEKVDEFFTKNKFDVVVHCGAKLHKDSMYENILMFENIVRAFKGKIIYFSSGAAVRGNPPTDQYGLSKWVIDRRILEKELKRKSIWFTVKSDFFPSGQSFLGQLMKLKMHLN